MNKLYYLLLILVISILAACDGRNNAYHIGVSQCSADSWRDKLNTELHTAACVYGNVQVEIATANDDSEKQREQIDDFVRCGVDLLIVAPNQKTSVTEAVERAYDAGIPILLIDRMVSSEKYTAYVGADNYAIGRTIGEWFCTVLARGDTIVEFRGLEGSSPAEERHRGFVDALQKKEDVTIIDGGSTDWTEDSAEETINKFIAEGGRANAVFGQNDRIAIVAQRLMGNRAKVYAGIDAMSTPSGGLQAVNQGLLDASCIYPTRGDIVMDVAMQILNHEPYQKVIELKTALITQHNANVVIQQTEDMSEMQERIAVMGGQIDHYLEQFDLQKTVILIGIACVFLLTLLATYVYWAERAKRRRDVVENEWRLRFFTTVSHEFRTPLTLIADPLSRLEKEENLTTEGHRILHVARRQTEVMLQLVGQILDLRKLQSNHTELNPIRVDLSASLSTWVEGFAILGESQGLTFRTSAPEELWVSIDAPKMERIVYNLISNAVKYAPAGTSIDIALSLSGNTLTLSVADHGRGIKQSELKKVFDRFYQGRGAVRGTGIGLSLVHDMAVVMGGEVTVESQEGQGARFVVQLPVGSETDSQAPVRELTYRTEAEPQQQTAAAETNGKTALIVDDNADIRNYLSQCLTAAGYTVVTANDGREGLGIAIERVPDIVISDIMMPIMTGRELCRKLKETTATSHIPVVLLTALAADDQRIDGYDAGADAYIAKPFSIDVVLARVKNLLEGRRHLREVLRSATLPTEAPQTEQAEVLSAEQLFMQRLRQSIEQHMGDSEFSVETLAADVNLSRIQMYRKVKALTGTSPVDLIREMRLQRADQLLRQGSGMTVSEVAYTVGFSSPSYFTKCYKDYYHKTPTE